MLGVLGTTISGTFLYLIAALNLVALAGILKVFRAMRAGAYDEKSWSSTWTRAGS